MSTTIEPGARAPVPATHPEPHRIMLYDILWSLYVQLRKADNSRHVRMSYWNGTLELMSPEHIHEKTSYRLTLLITT